MKLKLHIFLFLLFVLKLNSQITSVGIIGTGSPLGNWDNDVDLVQDTANLDLWTLSATLLDGEVKFRANDSWDLAWGDKTFPFGIGLTEGGSPNMRTIAGNYNITFNSATGQYFFDYLDSNVGIIGAGLPIFDWDRDINMFKDANDANKFYITLTLEKDGVLFRENDDWALKYGSAATEPNFPSGTLVKGGGNDIKVSEAGEFLITIDTLEKVYNFAITGYKSIGLIGDATPTGWGADTNMVKDVNLADFWYLHVDLTTGGVKFRADDEWTNNWGGTAWPQGTGVFNSGDNIPAQEGRYRVEFNTKTLDYNFIEIKDYALVGIIGDATPSGVDTETAMTADANVEGQYTLRVKLTEGFLQFVTDEDRWAAGDFPSGTAEIDGGDIPIPAGEYKITFNSITGVYNFEAIVEYGKISLVGKSGPSGEWPGDDDSRDTYLNKDANDFNHWTLASVELTDFAAVTDGGVKFRAEAAWAINWGAADFPAGVGVLNGPNIRPVAGTYSVDFRSDTGEYAFGEANSTIDYLSDAVIGVYPNPTSAFINIDVKEGRLKGKTQIALFDMSGKMVYNLEANTNDIVKINASSFNNGKYNVRISNDKFFVSKNIVVVK